MGLPPYDTFYKHYTNMNTAVSMVFEICGALVPGISLSECEQRDRGKAARIAPSSSRFRCLWWKMMRREEDIANDLSN